MNGIRTQKGQTAMLELLFGTILVLVIMVAIINALQGAFTATQARQVFSDFTFNSEIVMEKILQGPGSTHANKTDWENTVSLSDVNQIGLTKAPYLLSIEKLRKLRNWTQSDYETVKKKLGLSGYEFSFSVIIRDYPSGYVHDIKDPVLPNVSYLEIGKSYYDIFGGSPDQSYWATKLERGMVLDDGNFQNQFGQIINIKNKPVLFQLKVYVVNPFEG